MNAEGTKFSLYDLVSDLPQITVVDVGALPMASEPEIYAPLIKAGKARLIGFEPDKEGCRQLKEKYGEPHNFFPFFIGDGKRAVFHKTHVPMAGSLFAPNTPLLNQYADLGRIAKLEGTESVQTHCLDHVVDCDEIDFLKMDVQGAELSVLKGAKRLLSTALVIQSEVEFIQLYLDQPLFADIDSHLRNVGFQFHTFLSFGSKQRVPAQTHTFKLGEVKQLLWSDAVYIPELVHLETLSNARLLKLAVLLHDLYGSMDYTLAVLDALKQRGQSAPYEAYLARLQSNQ
jgi:FkbM family methyltransferase